MMPLEYGDDEDDDVDDDYNDDDKNKSLLRL